MSNKKKNVLKYYSDRAITGIEYIDSDLRGDNPEILAGFIEISFICVNGFRSMEKYPLLKQRLAQEYITGESISKKFPFLLEKLEIKDEC